MLRCFYCLARLMVLKMGETLTHEAVLGDIGMKIAEFRVRQGWTQEELAEQVGTPVKYEQAIEAGKTNITIRTLVRFANTLGVSPADLLKKPAPHKRRPGRPRSSSAK